MTLRQVDNRQTMGKMRRPYREFDDIVEGDIVELGGTPRRVLLVTRDELDRVRFIGVNRLACGYARRFDGSTVRYCSGPVLLYHTDLKTPRYRFGGWLKRSREAPDE